MVDNAYASSTVNEPVNSFGSTKVRTAANHDYQQLLNDGLSQKQVDLIAKEDKYTAHTYTHVPVVLSRGEGVYVYDADGTKYLDYLSAYFSVNQGHCHPRIVAAAHKQLDVMTMASRAFFNDQLGSYAEYMCGVFGFDKLLPMNTGVEGGETAVKLARRWGYQVKKIAENQARVVFARGNYWGRSFAALSSSADPSSYSGYGPYLPNLDLIPYNDLPALEKIFTEHGKDICAFMVEPIQGNAGVVVPEDKYMPGVRALCDKHQVLLICDEVQTGLGRTGRLIACDHYNIKPDILVLGKALSGGLMPVSAVLANDNVMLQIHRGEHGSTFGGNPLGCAIGREAIQVLLDEKLPENAEAMGQMFRGRIMEMKDKFHGIIIKGVRGKGLLNAVMLQGTESRKDIAYDFCVALRNKGLLARHSSATLIVFAPPLIINAEQMKQGCDIIEEVASRFAQESDKDATPAEHKQQN